MAIYFDKTCDKWAVRFYEGGKREHYGYFDSEREAKELHKLIVDGGISLTTKQAGRQEVEHTPEWFERESKQQIKKFIEIYK